MKSIKGFSIKKKLILIQLVTTSSVLLFYSIFHHVRDTRIYIRSVNRELSSITELIGSSCVSALYFLDKEAAKNILFTLEVEDHVVNSWIHDGDGNLFAEYNKTGYDGFNLDQPSSDFIKKDHQFLIASKSIVHDNEIIGFISIRYNIEHYQQILFKNKVIALVIFLIAIGTAWLLAIFTQRTISNPILKLLENMKQISDTRDYSIRPVKERDDEIGALFDGFLEMVEQIQIHEAEQDLMTVALHESEEKYRNLVERANDGIIILQEGIFKYVNPSLVEMAGCSKEELIENPFVDFIHEEEVAKVMDNYERRLAGETVNSMYETRFKTSKGEVVDAEVNAGSIMYEGKPADLVIIRNITERKRSEEKLRESEEKYRSLFETTGTATIVYNDDKVIRMCNQKFEELYGKPSEEIINRIKWPDFVHPDNLPRMMEYHNQRSTGEPPSNYEFKFVTAEGTTRHIFHSVIYLEKTGERIASLLDITDLKHAEEELRKHQEQLEEMVIERTAELEVANKRLLELDRLKSMFLASMSHELRTPLNSIIGFTGILLMEMAGKLNPEQKKQLEMVKGSASHLLELINDILDISKIESGKVDLSIESFDLMEVVREVLTSIQPLAENKGLQLSSEGAETIQIESDRRRIKQILMNLTGNSVKFTDKGSIQIHVKCLNDHTVSVEVKDTGIGIREEELGKLFQPFQQIDMTSTKKYEGTGLGLYLTQKIVTHLHGKISVVSTYGEGSIFTFTLPMKWQEESGNEKSADH